MTHARWVTRPSRQCASCASVTYWYTRVNQYFGSRAPPSRSASARCSAATRSASCSSAGSAHGSSSKRSAVRGVAESAPRTTPASASTLDRSCPSSTRRAAIPAPGTAKSNPTSHASRAPSPSRHSVISPTWSLSGSPRTTRYTSRRSGSACSITSTNDTSCPGTRTVTRRSAPTPPGSSPSPGATDSTRASDQAFIRAGSVRKGHTAAGVAGSDRSSIRRMPSTWAVAHAASIRPLA